MNKNVIEVQNNKNILFFYYNFINIALNIDMSILMIEMYNLILEIAILYLESCFLLIIFLNSHLIIDICYTYLNKILDAT